MENRTGFDRQFVTGVSIFVLAITGYLLLPSMLHGTLTQSAATAATVLIVTIIFWLGFTSGTYFSINKEHGLLMQKYFFFKRKAIRIAEIKEIKTGSAFGGLVSHIFMTIQTNTSSSKLLLTSVGVVKKEDLKGMLHLMQKINPALKVEDSLLR